jgi:hypothetical protein
LFPDDRRPLGTPPQPPWATLSPQEPRVKEDCNGGWATVIVSGDYEFARRQK